jgi:hypothetical protein
MLKNALLCAALVSLAGVSMAQTTFLPLGTENYYTLDRLETLHGRLSDSLCLTSKPETRRSAVNFIESLMADTAGTGLRFSNIDRYNMEQMVSESGEWACGEDGAIQSKHPILNTFYKTQYNLGYVKTKDFFIVVNPVFNGTVLHQSNTASNTSTAGVPDNVYLNSHGAEVRGWIAKKIGFYTMLTDNQESLPLSVYNYATKLHEAVPGVDYFKRPNSPYGTYDYFQATGYFNFDVIKEHLNATAGFGKHFIGDGLTSLLLTDNSASTPYLQLRARIWKLNYDVLYLELTPQYNKVKDDVIGHKYSTMHYLTWNATRWLNVGAFEAQVFSRPDRYEFSYMNPIIFTTAMSRYNGAGDKSLVGLTAKALVAHHLQFYGQFFLNEFRIGELLGNRGWYGNKWGLQLGGKYFNAFGINNLDLQGEVDAVRPYAYSAQDSIANYTNYNQALADPLGSGYVKIIGQVKYQPMRNLYLTARVTYYTHGNNDPTEINRGNNIFEPYTTTPASYQYAVPLINGVKSTCQMLSFNASYQFRRNMFVDLGGIYRKYTSDDPTIPLTSSTGVTLGDLTSKYFYVGIRINAARRAYDNF